MGTNDRRGLTYRDSFFSINRGRSAYSGTATFSRKGIADAAAAQEGVTGMSCLFQPFKVEETAKCVHRSIAHEHCSKR